MIQSNIKKTGLQTTEKNIEHVKNYRLHDFRDQPKIDL